MKKEGKKISINLDNLLDDNTNNILDNNILDNNIP